MSLAQPTQTPTILVAVDIAKLRHEVLIEAPGWRSRRARPSGWVAIGEPGGEVFDGSLCLPVPLRGLQACGDRAAVVLKGGPGGVQVIMLAEGLTLCWLHESQFAWLA